MQRIDENTYIDDTLVTCAEYQLFIDEMREQGKYYQPDHWTSYQFPAGQARKPILGVRHLDAVAFCEWLKQREGTEWSYRLLTEKEAIAYPLRASSKSSVHGYWTKDTEFIWDGLAPKNVHSINDSFARTLARVLDHDKTLNPRRVHVLKFEPVLAHASARPLQQLEFDRNLDISSHLDPDLKLARARALDHARALDLELDQTRTFVQARALDYEFAIFLEKAIDINQNFDNASALAYRLKTDRDDIEAVYGNDSALNPARVLDRVRALDQALARATTLANELYIKLDRDINNSIKLVQSRATQLKSDYDRTLDLLVDIVILQERIAGRSPAFEGIRLVKERIK